MLTTTQLLIEKIQILPPERMAEVDDFVEFLKLREQDRQLTHAAAWDNSEDETYDTL